MKRRVRKNESGYGVRNVGTLMTNSLAANEYTALHEGKTPTGTVLERIEPFAGRKNILGQMTEIQYAKAVTDGTYPYHHPFAEHAQPTIFVDSTGQLGAYRGRYVTTYRGIEDRTHGQIEDERLPGRATRLVTLGKVEFFRYKWEDEDGEVKTEEIRFTDRTAPTLSHDQRGDLRFTGGSPLKEHATMKTDSTGKSRSRRNPSGARSKDNSMVGRGKRILVTGLAVGLGSAATMIGVNMLFAKYGLTWGVPARAAAKMAVGIAGAMVAGMALPGVPALAAGIAVGGVTAGLGDLYVAYLAQRLNRAAAGVGAAHTSPLLGAGRVPQGYGVNSGAACGVG